MGPAILGKTNHACARVIVASPDVDFRRRIVRKMSGMSWIAGEAKGGAEALSMIEGGGVQALLLDNGLPDLNAGEISAMLAIQHPEIDVVILDPTQRKPPHGSSGFHNARTKQLYWILRDLESCGTEAAEPEFLRSTVMQSGVESCAPIVEGVFGIDLPQPKMLQPLPGVIGSADSLLQVARLVRLVAPHNATALITGETGTGKELIAHAIHRLSPRSGRPFVVVNCAAIPENLLESELFGYARGAFTGAVQSKTGRIQAAHGGSLFLDEVGDMPAALQAKLLRFLQEGEVQRLGSAEIEKVDVRVIAATNADLSDPVKFRKDLYYRLAVFPIEVPPLRARGDDAVVLAEVALAHLCRQSKVELKRLTTPVCESLQHHSWPGNVRELQHLIERAFILSEQSKFITLDHLPSLASDNHQLFFQFNPEDSTVAL